MKQNENLPEVAEAATKVVEKKIVVNISMLTEFVAASPEIQLRTVETLREMPELTLSQAVKFAARFEQLKAQF